MARNTGPRAANASPPQTSGLQPTKSDLVRLAAEMRASGAVAEAEALINSSNDGGRGVFSDYLTPQELARELQITERHLTERQRAGLGPPRTVVGRVILYRKDSVVAWLRTLEEGYQDPHPPANHGRNPRGRSPRP